MKGSNSSSSSSSFHLTSLLVIQSLTRTAANILKAVIPNRAPGMDSETDVHCGDITFPVICDNQVTDCQDATAVWPSLLVAVLY